MSHLNFQAKDIYGWGSVGITYQEGQQHHESHKPQKDQPLCAANLLDLVAIFHLTDFYQIQNEASSLLLNSPYLTGSKNLSG